jgi:hypothetical protein
MRRIRKARLSIASAFGSPASMSSLSGDEAAPMKRKASLPGYDDRGYNMRPVEQIPVFACYRDDDLRRRHKALEDSEITDRGSGASPEEDVSGPAAASPSPDPDVDPLTASMTNIDRKTFQVSWYAEEISPARRFMYWAYSKLRCLPVEWRDYYRRLLRQEIRASRHVVVTWDSFMMIVEGYRKVKWVLRKYEVPLDETEIPAPYNNFWEQTTHEERLWAHRRSFQLKEMQAVQRDDDEIVFGAFARSITEAVGSRTLTAQSGQQHGTPCHAMDLPAPSEHDVHTTQADEDMSSALFSSAEDDKLWNPVLKQRFLKATTRAEAELYAFEDEEDDIYEKLKR